MAKLRDWYSNDGSLETLGLSEPFLLLLLGVAALVQPCENNVGNYPSWDGGGVVVVVLGSRLPDLDPVLPLRCWVNF